MNREMVQLVQQQTADLSINLNKNVGSMRIKKSTSILRQVPTMSAALPTTSFGKRRRNLQGFVNRQNQDGQNLLDNQNNRA
ncbi:23064_t:CDS:2 [Rhizophagus irregularis]|nr:23064_t:CDS:2 [Rhizophagus irregularis]